MTRILFVDDETSVLEGLRLSLRARRKVWDMVFVDSVEAALADIERTPVDVVVSDMRMPAMDGAEFLTRVAIRRPEATRIVLSGQMDEGAAVRAASVAHRFLSKPCAPEMLEAVIAQALELRDSLSSEKIRARIGGVDSLPCLPRAYVELNQALSDADIPMRAIARIIESDPAMAAKILQLVNSSFFGLPRRVVNIEQAVSFLGVGTMKNLALADSLFQELGTADVRAAERERDRSLLRARIARRLFTVPSKAEAAVTAALLLHVGTLVLQSRLPAEHALNQSAAEERRLPLHEVEREVLGITHAEVGAYLLGLWGLPHDIIDAVAKHHSPWSEITTLDVRGAVRVADALTSAFLSGSEVDSESEPPAALLRELGVADTVARMRSEIPAALREPSP